MPVLMYTLQRLCLLVLAALALLLLGMRGWLVVLVATLVGWGLSYVFLPRQRAAAASWLAERDARRKASRGAPPDEAAEDAEAERAERLSASDDERAGAPSTGDVGAAADAGTGVGTGTADPVTGTGTANADTGTADTDAGTGTGPGTAGNADTVTAGADTNTDAGADDGGLGGPGSDGATPRGNGHERAAGIVEPGDHSPRA